MKTNRTVRVLLAVLMLFIAFWLALDLISTHSPAAWKLLALFGGISFLALVVSVVAIFRTLPKP